MKKVLLFFAFMVASIVGAVNASAQSTTTLTGKLIDVTMNEKHYSDVENVSFLFVDYGNGTGTLTSLQDIGPIGKMPGSIAVNMSVTINSDGSWSATAGGEAGKLNLKVGGSMNIYTTSLSGNSKKFVLDTYALKVFGVSAFDASVTFVAY